MSEITVLIPSYNHAPFIERTLRSVYKQSLAPKKLIVIDDGSKDESVKIIEQVLVEAPFDSVLISRPNRGLCATLNEGFDKCETDYFAYIGSDDVWLPDFLKSRTEVLTRRTDAVAAFGHAYLIDEQDNIIDCTQEWGEYPDGSILPILMKMVTPASAAFLYRSRFLEKVSWNEESVLEDYELYLKLSAIGDFALDTRILCGWRQHGWNVSKNYPKMLQESLEAQERIAPELGISKIELDKYQAAIKFNSAFDFIRRGERGKALSMMRQNMSGAESLSQVAKILLRLVVPRNMFEQNRTRMRSRNITKYGKLTI